jgi:hypothetical protein
MENKEQKQKNKFELHVYPLNGYFEDSKDYLLYCMINEGNRNLPRNVPCVGLSREKLNLGEYGALQESVKIDDSVIEGLAEKLMSETIPNTDGLEIDIDDEFSTLNSIEYHQESMGNGYVFNRPHATMGGPERVPVSEDNVRYLEKLVKGM